MSRMFIFYLGSLVLRSFALGAIGGFVLLRARNVEFRHAVWTVVLCAALLMPIVDAVFPAALVPASVPEVLLPIQTFILVAPQTAVHPVSSVEPAPAAIPIDWWQVCLVFILIVTVAFLTRFVLVLRQVQRIKKGSRRVESVLWDEWRTDRGDVALTESPSVKIPLTIGFWKPFVILPLDWRSWEDWKLRDVLMHELTHIHRWDWAVTVIAAFAKCVFWFNPLAWWLERRLSSLAELASDEASVRFSGNPRRYAETLLQFAAAARQGHRWIGGVAMAQHKISLRIERVLALQRPGSGILSRTAWAALCLAALPALYASAATQSTPGEIPLSSPAEILQALQPRIPIAPQLVAAIQEPSPPPSLPPQEQAPASPPAAPTPAPVPQAVPPQGENAPVVINPDLVGEIRLILAPVDVQTGPGQVQIQTRTGTTRYTGTAVWNIQNGALNPNTWTANGNAFTFTLTGIQNRTMQFEGANGGSFSYGCADCSFLVWETGVGAPSASLAPGIVFQLSPDGKSLTATCRASACRAAGKGQEIRWTAPGLPGTVIPSAVLASQARDSQTWTFPITRDVGSARTCFSLFGNVKIDGTPFTDADCPSTVAVGPVTTVVFSVTRD